VITTRMMQYRPEWGIGGVGQWGVEKWGSGAVGSEK
jgi:hypothetical protein